MSTLPELKKELKNGDLIRTCTDKHLPQNTFMYKNGELWNYKKTPAELSFEQATRDDWQIIPAEPVVLSAEEAWNKTKNFVLEEFSHRKDVYEIGYEDGTKNGELKERKNLKPAIDLLREWNGSETVVKHFSEKVESVLKNIQPLEKQ